VGGSQLYKVVAGTTPFVPFTGATVNEIPVQVALAMVLILGVGCTSMVEVLGSPLQPLDMGVTVMVAVTSTFDVLTAVKEAMLPLPEAASPIEGVLFIQLYSVPDTGDPSKLIVAVGVNPLQTI
jgi:hypothetical protein